MAAAVEVLCPSGHRQKVKITPNTKILQILEEVCNKKGFLPPDDYELKHGRKALDVTLTIRYAGIPNHAKLELVKGQKTRSESEVTLALQVEDQRHQHSFHPSVTLWQVLLHWEKQLESTHQSITKGPSEELSPVCAYMREEVIGQYALEQTTLRSLGLTGGRAMVRLSHRKVDQHILDSIKEKIDKEKNRQAKIVAKAQMTESSSQSTPVQSTSEAARPESRSNITTESPMETDITPKNSDAMLIAAEGSGAPVSGSTRDDAGSSGKDDNNGEAMEVEVDSVSSQQEEAGESMEQVVTSGAQAAREGTLVGGMSPGQRQEAGLSALERMPGVEVIRPGDFDDLPPAQQQRARELAAEAFPGIFPSVRTARPKRKPLQQAPVQANPFSNFKFPESTKGQNLYQNELSDISKEEFASCDRETCLYSLDERRGAATASAADDIPDSFFEVTVNDVQKMYADLQKNVGKMEEQMLMTSAMRQRAAEEKLARYPRAIIRVQFPDRHVLQGVFRPRETVYSLQKFVKQHLEEKSTAFYLYTTPPRCILKDNSQMLHEANLVPMSVIHFGSEVQKESYLSTAVLKEIDSQGAADRIVFKHMSDKSGEFGEGSSGTGQKRTTSTRSGEGTSQSAEPKVPKWFRVGKK